MSQAYAIVPSIGGVALLVGGTAAFAIDRADLVADATELRPIFLRYTSQATFALKKRPHWIFLGAVCIFSPCLMVTAQWQGELVSAFDEDLQGQIILYATACAVGGFGVALLPMGNALGTVVHTVMAGIFAAFGINYAFRAYSVADELGNDRVASLRLGLALLGSLGGVVTIFCVYPGVAGTSALEAHKKIMQQNPDATPETQGVLTPRGILMARLGETALAVGQISIALAMALTLLSAAGEVGDVSDSPPAAWIVGVVSGIAMCLLASVFYYTNDKWYAMCQAEKPAPDDKMDDEETKKNDNIELDTNP